MCYHTCLCQHGTRRRQFAKLVDGSRRCTSVPLFGRIEVANGRHQEDLAALALVSLWGIVCVRSVGAGVLVLGVGIRTRTFFVFYGLRSRGDTQMVNEPLFLSLRMRVGSSWDGDNDLFFSALTFARRCRLRSRRRRFPSCLPQISIVLDCSRVLPTDYRRSPFFLLSFLASAPLILVSFHF